MIYILVFFCGAALGAALRSRRQECSQCNRLRDAPGEWRRFYEQLRQQQESEAPRDPTE